ncbi:hypothetical protein GNI_063800 [Gregarina niphandrodes]|uniref:tRNA pseudouridine(55) synthase n=1 Tax=Gregarina niphandrodes TaxID=110365 RepID=A0A023B7Y9_GRENI|nr:hypothetical protein GNI_063800 [Gregarina niphandrodes]EZG68160.1 hypothetical protein GNI_063800 [Gregarina niphandrodes]|eukprot:XP_011130054.1 hypothetical protein GNI_063800 [Gregarina niphandrodes]
MENTEVPDPMRPVVESVVESVAVKGVETEESAPSTAVPMEAHAGRGVVNSVSKCCDACQGFDKKCFNMMVPSNVACCVVCEARNYGRANILHTGFYDPTATLRVGVCVPPWLRTELSEELLRALRQRIQCAVLDVLRSERNISTTDFSGESSVRSAYCLVKNPLYKNPGHIVQEINTAGDANTLGNKTHDGTVDNIPGGFSGGDPEAAVYVLDLVYTSPFCDVVKKRKGRKRYMKEPPLNWSSRPLKLTVAFQALNHPIVYQGRYNKLARDVAQTKWINNEYTSIEELLGAKANQVHRCSEFNLIGSGREDVDVKMLGQGRPFLLVLKNSKILPSCRKIKEDPTEATISQEEEVIPLMAESYRLRDGDVLIHDLRLISEGFKQVSQTTKAFQETIAKKLKMYSAQITTNKAVDVNSFNDQFDKILNVDTIPCDPSCSRECVLISKNADSLYNIQSMPSVPALEVEQRTPLRVAHRRADLIRKRNIYSMRITLNSSPVIHDDFSRNVTNSSTTISPSCKYTLEILGSAGLYIKEFVHSDLGRTKPSLAALFRETDVTCDITQLDVLNLLALDNKVTLEEDS